MMTLLKTNIASIAESQRLQEQAILEVSKRQDLQSLQREREVARLDARLDTLTLGPVSGLRAAAPQKAAVVAVQAPAAAASRSSSIVSNSSRCSIRSTPQPRMRRLRPGRPPGGHHKPQKHWQLH